MRIETVPTSTLDEATATELAAIDAAYSARDAPHNPPVVAESLRLRLVHGEYGRPSDLVLVARDDSGRAAGWCAVEFLHWDNRDTAFLEPTVDPSARGQGIGSALFAEAEAFCEEHGRTNLLAETWVGNPGGRFASSRGFAHVQDDAQRRLDLRTLDWSRIHALHDQAAGRAQDYELLRWVGATPGELLADMVAVHTAINDAPLDELVVDDEEYSVERLRAFDQAMAARQQLVYKLVARRSADGELAGHTFVIVDRLLPTWAFQEDTSVVPAHRGHSLGLFLKTEMLRWLREAEPSVGPIDTWNAASNTHMIAVNDMIGCQEVGRADVWQRSPARREPAATTP